MTQRFFFNQFIFLVSFLILFGLPFLAFSADKLVVKDVTNKITFKVEDNGTLTSTKALFGEEATSVRGARVANLIGAAGVMRMWRIHDLYPAGFDFIHSKPITPDTIDSNWHIFAGPYSGDMAFGIMDRVPTDKVRFSINSNGNVGIGLGTKLASYPLEMASGAHVTTGGVWVNASSRELKENIKEVSAEEAVATLVKLEPVQYNYKTDKKEQYVGFIAEDVPDMVAVNDRKGLSAMDITAVLTKVVQEQQKTIAELQERLAEVEIAMQFKKDKDLAVTMLQK